MNVNGLFTVFMCVPALYVVRACVRAYVWAQIITNDSMKGKLSLGSDVSQGLQASGPESASTQGVPQTTDAQATSLRGFVEQKGSNRFEEAVKSGVSSQGAQAIRLQGSVEQIKTNMIEEAEKFAIANAPADTMHAGRTGQHVSAGDGGMSDEELAKFDVLVVGAGLSGAGATHAPMI